MKRNGVVCWPGPALTFLLFAFQYLISGPKSYRDFADTGPWAGLEPGTARLWVQSADHYSTLSLPVWLSALHYNQRGLAAVVSRPGLMSHPRKRHLRLLQPAAPASNKSGSTFAEIMSFLHTSLLRMVALDDLVVLVTDRKNSLHFEYWWA